MYLVTSCNKLAALAMSFFRLQSTMINLYIDAFLFGNTLLMNWMCLSLSVIRLMVDALFTDLSLTTLTSCRSVRVMKLVISLGSTTITWLSSYRVSKSSRSLKLLR